MAQHWYVVHTYSGFEQKAKKALEEKVRAMGKESVITEVLIPSESVVEMKKGVKKTTNRKIFPGYILVRMELDDETWHIIKSVPKVTGFVGGTKEPPVVPDEEVQRITKQISEGTLLPSPRFPLKRAKASGSSTAPSPTSTGSSMT
jgi:transcriptional antiterminator NusG